MKTLTLTLASVFALSLSATAMAAGDPIKLMSDKAGYDQLVPQYVMTRQNALDKEAIDENPWLSRVQHDISDFATAADAEERNGINDRTGGFNVKILY